MRAKSAEIIWSKRIRHSLLVVVFACGFVGLSSSIAAQVPPEVQKIAAQTVKQVAKLRVQAILVTPRSGCLGMSTLCGELDAAIHAELEKSISGVRFIDTDTAAKHLAEHGFLSIDGYLGALDDVASDAGAEVVIGEDFRIEPGHCKVLTTVADSKHHYDLGEHSENMSCTAVTTKMTLAPITDAMTGTSLFVPMPWSPGLPKDHSPVRFPVCVSCPAPPYSGLARQSGLQGKVLVLITVNQKGEVEDPVPLSAVDEGLARNSLDAVRGWRLKPPIGLDGNPVKMRVVVQVSFRLLS